MSLAARHKEARADFLDFLSPLSLPTQASKLVAAAETLAGRRPGRRPGGQPQGVDPLFARKRQCKPHFISLNPLN